MKVCKMSSEDHCVNHEKPYNVFNNTARDQLLGYKKIMELLNALNLHLKCLVLIIMFYDLKVTFLVS